MDFFKSIAAVYEYIDDKVVVLNESIVAGIIESTEYTDEVIAALPPIGNCSFKTGVYTGNGIDDREINIGVNLAAKTNVYIIIKSLSATLCLHRIEYGQGDLTMRYDVSVDFANAIQSFSDNGFIIGNYTGVNTNNYTYRYIVFWKD